MLAEDGAEHPELRAGVRPSAEHVLQLDRLISDQADELAEAEATRRELIALCDLAEWATETAGAGPAVVLVEDLRRVLARRHGAAGS